VWNIIRIPKTSITINIIPANVSMAFMVVVTTFVINMVIFSIFVIVVEKKLMLYMLLTYIPLMLF